MTRGLALVAALAGSLLAASGARALFCDRLATIPLPVPCATGAYGLAFDGEILYYTLRDDPEPGRVRKVRAATGADEGSFAVTSAGQPLGPLGGLAWDPARRMLWVSAADTLSLVRPSDGEVVRSLARAAGGGASLAYDVVYDVLFDWVGSTGRCYPVDGSGCHGEPTFSAAHGLTFDGRDLWSFTQFPLPPDYPDFGPRLFPIDHENLHETSWRACDTPLGFLSLFEDLAYDCATFPAPVVWGSAYQWCRLEAYQVEPGTPCPNSADHLSRLRLHEATRAALVPRLPVTAPSARDSFQVSRPLAHRLAFEMRDTFFALAAYRLLGPGDVDRGNVLRVVREGDDIVVSE